MFLRAKTIIEWSDMPPVPPPFNLLSMPFRTVRLLRWCCCGGALETRSRSYVATQRGFSQRVSLGEPSAPAKAAAATTAATSATSATAAAAPVLRHFELVKDWRDGAHVRAVAAAVEEFIDEGDDGMVEEEQVRSALMKRVATVQRAVERIELEARAAHQHEARTVAKGLQHLETKLDAKLELVLSRIGNAGAPVAPSSSSPAATPPRVHAAAAAAAAAAYESIAEAEEEEGSDNGRDDGVYKEQLRSVAQALAQIKGASDKPLPSDDPWWMPSLPSLPKRGMTSMLRGIRDEIAAVTSLGRSDTDSDGEDEEASPRSEGSLALARARAGMSV